LTLAPCASAVKLFINRVSRRSELPSSPLFSLSVYPNTNRSYDPASIVPPPIVVAFPSSSSSSSSLYPSSTFDETSLFVRVAAAPLRLRLSAAAARAG
jgi:hypothetical protein